MNRTVMMVAAVVLVVVGFVASGGLFTVHQTQQALVLQFGNPKRLFSEDLAVVREPGLTFKLPLIQNVVYLDKRILAYDAPAEEIIASDQKRLVVDAFLRYRIVDPLKFYQSVGNEAVARSRLGSVLNSNLRQVLGSVEFANLLTGERTELMERITQGVSNEAVDFGIEAVDVRIKRADLPEANSQAIFRRMQTEREREAKEFRAQGAEISQRIRSRADRERTVLLAEANKQSEILRGDGDGQVVKIFAAAFGKDVEFFTFYRSMEAYKKALGDEQTRMVLSPDSEFFRYFGDITGGGNKAD
jgi:membrane protease subunit HflC